MLKKTVLALLLYICLSHVRIQKKSQPGVALNFV